MCRVDHGLAVFHDAVAVLEVERSRADGLDLRPLQLDTGLETVLHKVIVIGLAVLRRDLDSLFLHGTVPPLLQSGSQYSMILPNVQGL